MEPNDIELPEWLNRNLRQVYGDVLNEPIPDEFSDLLKKLDERTDGSDSDSGGNQN